MRVEAPGDDLQIFIKSLNALHWTCSSNANDPTACRALERLRGPMVELMSYVVASILEEMRNQPHDPQVQGMGVRVLRVLIQENEPLKQIALLRGGVEVLVLGVRQHPTNENLLSGALEVMEELQGVPSLLQALDHLKESLPGTRAALWAFSESTKSKWPEVCALPPHDLMRIVLSAVDAHKDDIRILASGLELMGNLLLDLPDARNAFAALGGWNWLLSVLEEWREFDRIQLHGCKVLSSLSKGGSWAEAHAKRALLVLEAAFVQHVQDECVLYWACWAVQQLNGARALVAPIRNGTFKTPGAMAAALRSLAGISLGQNEGANVEDMPIIIEAVLHAMACFPDRYDVLYEGAIVLGHVGAFAVGKSHAAAGDDAHRRSLLSSGDMAVNAIVQLIVVRMGDAHSVKTACEALAEIAEACEVDSPLKASMIKRLYGQGTDPGEPLLSRVTSAHVSNEQLQATLMWLGGVMNGVAPVVQQMVQHSSSHAVQLPGVRTLSLLYGERIELEGADLDCLPEALSAVCASMSMFPENIILQQQACYALCTMVEHTAGVERGLSEDALRHCLTAAGEALRLVRGRCDSRGDPASYNALYLRKEATRCIVAICTVQPVLGQWLRDQGLQESLADALKSTAESVWDGLRDAEAEETLRLELLALSYVLGPPTAILETLRRWGLGKPAVVRAAADAVVELARGGASDLAATAVSAPLQALHAAGCGPELMAAMRVHAADEDLQGRLHLAVGFVGHAVTAA